VYAKEGNLNVKQNKMPKKWSLDRPIRQNIWCENLLHAAEANYCNASQETLHFLQDKKIDQHVHASPQLSHSLDFTKLNSHPHVAVIL
jgi:hypothetical protein